MEKRWNVYHGNDYLGLKTAKEIREALRQGTLDPFDKVSREGSNIREDLIEVDEIFRETGHVPSESAQFSSDNSEGTFVGERSPLMPSVGESAGSAPRSQRQERPEVSTEAAYESDELEDFSQRNDTGSRNSSNPSNPSNSSNSTKRYYLIDRSKVLGPLSALEIQSLFNRNMLNKKVRVQKIGNEKTIHITQFIASYSGDRLKELTEEGRVPQSIGVGSPSSKVMNELARMASSRRVAQDRKNHAYLVMSLVGLILGAVVYVLYEQSTSSHSREPHAVGVEERSEETEPVTNKPTKSRPRLVQKAPEPVARPEPPKKKPEKARAEPARPEPTKRVETQAKPAPAARKPAPGITRASQNNGEGRPTDNIPQGPGPIAKAIESAGRIQTVGPLTFSNSALENCSGKCTLTLFDGTGASMRAVFFKNAYSEQLRTRAKGAFLTGNTKIIRGELTIFIQDVR
jgi:hypothetical protein